MGIFQSPFGKNKGNNAQVSYEEPVEKDMPVIGEEIDTSGVRWMSEPHVACVFLLDTSGSMLNNDAIGKLNEGIRVFKEQTMSNTTFEETTKACIDVAFVSFGPDVKVVQDFVPVSEMEPPILSASGNTPMGAALEKALDMVKTQKKKYTALGTPYYRPWVFCITDGKPNDSYASAAQRLKKEENEKKVLGYCVGVENFDRNVMATVFDETRLYRLENLDFSGLFKFVSNSLSVVRNSGPSVTQTVDVEAPHTLTIAY